MSHHPRGEDIPRGLITLEVVGTALIMIGVIESFGLQLLVPPALRFDGYGLVLIATGLLLVAPLVGHLLRPVTSVSTDRQ